MLENLTRLQASGRGGGTNTAGGKKAGVPEKQMKSLDKKKGEWVESEMASISGDAETTAQTIKKMGWEAVAFFGDITDFDVAEKLIQTAVDSFGKIDILVNVAAAFGFSP